MAILTFGKYRGQDIMDVAANNPEWVAWACLTSAFERFLQDNNLSARVVICRPGRDAIAEIEMTNVC